MKINHDVSSVASLGKRVRALLSRRNILGYLKNRIGWHCYPRIKLVRAYPLHVDIELSSHCQLKCPMCFRHHRPIEKMGHMSFDVFRKIIDELSGKVYSIKFTGRGEPLLNKDFCRFIEYVRGKDVKEVALITNGQLLSSDIMKSLIENEVDRVAFSVDGLKEEYESIRAPMKYSDIVETVSAFKSMRSSMKAKKPQIRIQAVKSTVERQREFIETWGPISDEILFLEYKDYSRDADDKEQAPYACPLLYQRLMIHWDGTVPMCINDEYEESVMGDVVEKSMREIWKDAPLREAREHHRRGMRGEKYENCNVCALHREGHGS